MTSVVQTIGKPDFKPSGNSVILFLANFHEACKPGGQMDTVFAHLATKVSNTNPNIHFYKIDAEEFSDIAEEYNIQAVPTILFLKETKVVDKIEGAFPAKLAERLDQFISTNKESTKNEVFKRIDNLITSNYVFLFMKGTPQEPKCKFSKKVLEILSQAGIKEFSSFNVLSDETIRQGLKDYSNWPTFPQLFAGGKLVGGVDICEELQNNGDLASALTPPIQEIVLPTPKTSQVVSDKKESLEERLKGLINQSPVMLFMKGSPNAPQCGFSAQIVSLLNQAGVAYGSFDILSDDTVRQGLKAYSDWPTYPQLYSNGKLVGGLDIVKELAEDGSLAEALM